MVYLRRYFLFFFWKMPKIWVGRATVNGEKKEDGLSVQRWRFPEQQLSANFHYLELIEQGTEERTQGLARLDSSSIHEIHD